MSERYSSYLRWWQGLSYYFWFYKRRSIFNVHVFMNGISTPWNCCGEGKHDSNKDHLLSLPALDSSNPHLITASINALTSENKVNLDSLAVCRQEGQNSEFDVTNKCVWDWIQQLGCGGFGFAERLSILLISALWCKVTNRSSETGPYLSPWTPVKPLSRGRGCCVLRHLPRVWRWMTTSWRRASLFLWVLQQDAESVWNFTMMQFYR